MIERMLLCQVHIAGTTFANMGDYAVVADGCAFQQAFALPTPDTTRLVVMLIDTTIDHGACSKKVSFSNGTRENLPASASRTTGEGPFLPIYTPHTGNFRGQSRNSTSNTYPGFIKPEKPPVASFETRKIPGAPKYRYGRTCTPKRFVFISIRFE